MASSSLFFVLLLFLISAGSQSQGSFLKLQIFRQTPSVDLHQALRADAVRHNSISSSPLVSAAISGSGQYLVHFKVGTPAQTIALVADTGSDLVWVRCSACRTRPCFLRHPLGSVFFPRASASFAPFHCYDSHCRLVPPDITTASHLKCNRSGEGPARLHTPCHYRYSYADLSSSSGFFSHDSATVENAVSGIPVKFSSVAFGCGFRNSGPSFSSGVGAHGVMGLGRGPTSFPSQLGNNFGNVFSYCLKDYTISPPPISYLLIGGDVRQHQQQHSRRHQFSRTYNESFHHLSFTPLLNSALSPSFYYVGVESVTVDGNPLTIEPSVFALDNTTGSGGTVLDSGTTLSFLPEVAYRQILAEMERIVRLPRVSIGAAGTGSGDPDPANPSPAFDLCVNVTGLGGKQLPRLGLKFRGGAMYSPPPRNYFVEAGDGVRCLALQPVAPSKSDSGFGVLGNLMQQGFLFVFDRDQNRVGFSRTGCTS